jgi:hypothetical protein
MGGACSMNGERRYIYIYTVGFVGSSRIIKVSGKAVGFRDFDATYTALVIMLRGFLELDSEDEGCIISIFQNFNRF